MDDTKKSDYKKSTRRRLSVPLSIKLYDKILRDADAMGVSPATYAGILIGQHYQQLEQTNENAKNAFGDMLSNLLTSQLGISKDVADNIVEESSKNSYQEGLDFFKSLSEHNKANK